MREIRLSTPPSGSPAAASAAMAASTWVAPSFPQPPWKRLKENSVRRASPRLASLRHPHPTLVDLQPLATKDNE